MQKMDKPKHPRKRSKFNVIQCFYLYVKGETLINIAELTGQPLTKVKNHCHAYGWTAYKNKLMEVVPVETATTTTDVKEENRRDFLHRAKRGLVVLDQELDYIAKTIKTKKKFYDRRELQAALTSIMRNMKIMQEITLHATCDSGGAKEIGDSRPNMPVSFIFNVPKEIEEPHIVRVITPTIENQP